MSALLLGQLLGLRPLDRLQINDAHELRELRSWQRMGNTVDCEPPYFYFQHITSDGNLKVSSPGGYLTTVSPVDVCNIIHGEPIIVRAMPRSVFMARQRLSLRERQQAPGDECYENAYVMRVEKDRWNRVDRVFVSFVDPSLNQGEPGACPIHQDDRRALEAKARRTTMPVMSGSRASGYSADQGVERQQHLCDATVRALLRCARRGDRSGVEKVSMAGASPLKMADLNRLGWLN